MAIHISQTGPEPILEPRPVQQSMLRGAAQHCPACGQGRLYSNYLKVNDSCPVCAEELHHQRADDAPPYFTMLIVGHIVVALVLIVEDLFAPALWVHALLWAPMILIMSLWLLPRIKGALIGLQWACGMHGFGGEEDDAFELNAVSKPEA